MPQLAFAGSGWIASVHALAAKTLDLPVTHVASRSPANAERLATRVGARACGYADLPAGADVVLVLTPPAQHAAGTLDALDAGAAVIVEKPLATTLAEADLLVAASDASGHRLAYAENLAYAPLVEQAVAEVASLGQLHHLEVRSMQGRPTWGDFLTEGWGGGALFDLGVHPIAVALLLAAPASAVSVSATLSGADDIPTDEHGEVAITFDTGLIARIVASWRGEDAVWDMQAASAAGVVRAELLPTPSLERDGEPIALPPLRAGLAAPQLEQYGYIGQLDAFMADFAAGRAPRSDVRFGRTVLEIVCAAYASAAAGGAAQAIPFTGPRDRTPLQLWRG